MSQTAAVQGGRLRRVRRHRLRPLDETAENDMRPGRRQRAAVRFAATAADFRSAPTRMRGWFVGGPQPHCSGARPNRGAACRRNGRAAVRWLIAAFFVVFCAPFAGAAEAPAAWAFRTYPVTVVVALPRTAELPPAEHRAWCDALAARLQSAYAPLWDTAVVAADSSAEKLLSDGPALLSLAAARSLSRPWPSAAKVIFVSIEVRDDRWLVLAREYDADVGFLGAVEQGEAASIDVLPRTAAAAVSAVFAPQARFESLPNGSLSLRPRGGQLRTREPLAAWAEGDVARLFLRPKPLNPPGAADASGPPAGGAAPPAEGADTAETPTGESPPAADEGESDSARHSAVAIPWTVAELTEAGSKGLAARVVTRLENPFDEARGLGIERLALRAGRLSRPTALRLLAAAESAPAEYAVFDVGDPKRAVCLGLTDRDGRMVVPPGEGVLRRLAVSDGGRILIEFPIIADGAAEVEVALSQSSLSPGIELFLLPARNALIDELARRAGPVARIEALVAAKQWDKAEELLAEVKKLPSGKPWVADLMVRLGKPPSAEARVIARIDAFRNESQQALDKQLGPDRISKWEKAIAEGRKPPEPPEGAATPDGSPPASGEGAATPNGSPPSGSESPPSA